MSARNTCVVRGQYLLTASWDSKKSLDAAAIRHLFGFLKLADADMTECDPAELVGRVFRVADADDARLYLEEVLPPGPRGRKKSA